MYGFNAFLAAEGNMIGRIQEEILWQKLHSIHRHLKKIITL